MWATVYNCSSLPIRELGRFCKQEVVATQTLDGELVAPARMRVHVCACVHISFKAPRISKSVTNPNVMSCGEYSTH